MKQTVIKTPDFCSFWKVQYYLHRNIFFSFQTRSYLCTYNEKHFGNFIERNDNSLSRNEYKKYPFVSPIWSDETNCCSYLVAVELIAIKSSKHCDWFIRLNYKKFPSLESNCNDECIILSTYHIQQLRVNLQYTNIP